MKNKEYSDEFKLQVIKEYLTSSLGCRAIAKKYNLPSKNYIHNWEQQLIKKGLLTIEECSKFNKKSHTVNSYEKKSAYEKELERENLMLRARLAYLQELERLINEDKKK